MFWQPRSSKPFSNFRKAFLTAKIRCGIPNWLKRKYRGKEQNAVLVGNYFFIGKEKTLRHNKA